MNIEDVKLTKMMRQYHQEIQRTRSMRATRLYEDDLTPLTKEDPMKPLKAAGLLTVTYNSGQEVATPFVLCLEFNPSKQLYYETSDGESSISLAHIKSFTFTVTRQETVTVEIPKDKVEEAKKLASG